MGYKEMYQSWLDNPYFDEDTKAELRVLREMTKRLKTGSIQSWSLAIAGLRGCDRSRNEPYEHLYGP